MWINGPPIIGGPGAFVPFAPRLTRRWTTPPATASENVLLLKTGTIDALACLKKEFMDLPIVVIAIFNSVILKMVGSMSMRKVYPRAFTTSKTTHSTFYRASFQKKCVSSLIIYIF